MGRQQDLFDTETPIGLFLPSEQRSPVSAAKFWVERHKIFLRKNRDQQKPWTQDPFLQSYRFCNIYRELDTVSLWIRENIIEKYEDHPDLWFMLAISRLINWPDTMQEMMDEGVWPEKRWNPDKVFKVLKARRDRKEKIITGAYIVNTVFPKNVPRIEGSKAEYIAYIGLSPMWEKRKEIRHQFKTTMRESVETFRQFHGWGSTFMPYQVTVDLTYSNEWLGQSEDLNKYVSPGPGTQRGLHRVLNGSPQPTTPVKEQGKLLRSLRKQVNEAAHAIVPKHAWTEDYTTGFQDLTLSNVHNLMCEYDKYCRLLSGEGKPRSRYPGSK